MATSTFRLTPSVGFISGGSITIIGVDRALLKIYFLVLLVCLDDLIGLTSRDVLNLSFTALDLALGFTGCIYLLSVMGSEVMCFIFGLTL